MHLIFKKLFRDIRRGLGQFLSMMLVIAVGCFFFAGMNEASYNLKKSVRTYYDEQNLAAVTGGFLVANDAAVELVAARDGVLGAAGAYRFDTFFTYHGSARVDATVTTLSEGFNTPLMETGRAPTSRDECIIDVTYAEAAGIQIGSEISLFSHTAQSVYLQTKDNKPPLDENGGFDFDKIDTENFNIVYTAPDSPSAEYRSLTVTGFFRSPEFIYKINTSDTSAQADEFACIYVTEAPIIAPSVDFYVRMGETDIRVYTQNRDDLTFALYNRIYADTDLGLDVFDVFGSNNLDLENGMVGVYVEAMSFVAEHGTAYKNFDTAYSQVRNLVIVIPLLFFLVAAVITFISLGKTVDNQRTQIGIMQAVGISKGGVYFGYLMYAGFAALFGSLLGGLLGAGFLPYIYYLVFTSQYVMPPFKMSFGIGWAALGVAVSLAVALLSALLSCHRTLKENPAQSMRPKQGKTVKKVAAEKCTGLWKRLPFGSKMICRNLFQNKVRVLLSSIGVIASMVLLITGVNLKSRIDYTIDDYVARIGFDVQITAQNAVSDAEEFIADYPSLKSATRAVSFAATVKAGDKRSDVLQVTAVQDEDYVNLYSDFKKKERIRMNDSSFVLPHYLADSLGVKKGDTVTVTAVGYGACEVVVSDVSYQYLLPGVYAGTDILTDVSAENVTSVIYARLADGAEKPEPDARIKSALDKDELRARALKMSEILDLAVAIIVIGAAVLAVTVIYNITSINVMERSREIATLMVLGYRKHETARLIIAENIVITIIGCLIGLPLGYGMFYWLAQVVSGLNVAIPVNLPVLVVLICLCAVFAFSMLATLFMTRKIMKIDMVEALKSVE